MAANAQEFLTLDRLRWELRLPANFGTVAKAGQDSEVSDFDSRLIQVRDDAIAYVAKASGVPIIDRTETLEVPAPIGTHPILITHNPWIMTAGNLQHWDASGAPVKASTVVIRVEQRAASGLTAFVAAWPSVASDTVLIDADLSIGAVANYPTGHLRAAVAVAAVTLFEGDMTEDAARTITALLK